MHRVLSVFSELNWPEFSFYMENKDLRVLHGAADPTWVHLLRSYCPVSSPQTAAAARSTAPAGPGSRPPHPLTPWALRAGRNGGSESPVGSLLEPEPEPRRSSSPADLHGGAARSSATVPNQKR